MCTKHSYNATELLNKNRVHEHPFFLDNSLRKIWKKGGVPLAKHTELVTLNLRYTTWCAVDQRAWFILQDVGRTPLISFLLPYESWSHTRLIQRLRRVPINTFLLQFLAVMNGVMLLFSNHDFQTEDSSDWTISSKVSTRQSACKSDLHYWLMCRSRASLINWSSGL